MDGKSIQSSMYDKIMSKRLMLVISTPSPIWSSGNNLCSPKQIFWNATHKQTINATRCNATIGWTPCRNKAHQGIKETRLRKPDMGDMGDMGFLFVNNATRLIGKFSRVSVYSKQQYPGATVCAVEARFQKRLSSC